MKKSFCFLIIYILISSCKSDSSRHVDESKSELDKIEVSTEELKDSETMNGSKEAQDSLAFTTGNSEDTSPSNTQTASSEDSAPKKKRKKVKKKSFNPPHIAVLEQEEYETYEEEVDAEPKSKVIPKKEEVVAKSLPKKEAKKQTSKVEPKPIEAKPEVTEIVFRRNFFSFGDIIQGDTVKFNFDFTNIGEIPLIIEDAKGSCSCTHPIYPIIPIRPGESGQITGIYVSDDKEGPQNASVTITANTKPSTHQLLLDGKVSVASKDEGDQN